MKASVIISITVLWVLNPILGFSQGTANLKLADRCYDQYLFDYAIVEYGKVLKQKPDNATALEKRALCYYITDLPDKAIEDYTELIRVLASGYPFERVNALVLRGTAYMKIGENEKALADFNQAIQLDPKKTEAYYKRGYCHLALGNSSMAQADTSLALTSAMDMAYVKLAQGNLKLKNLYYKKVKNDMEMAEMALSSSVTQTINYYSDAIKTIPAYAPAYIKRAILRGYLHKNEEAMADINKAIESYPNDPDFYGQRGSLYMKLKEFELAIADFRTENQLDTNHDDAFMSMAACYDSLGKNDKILEIYNEFQRWKPDTAEIYFCRGALLSKMGKYKEAVADFDKIQELAPYDYTDFKGWEPAFYYCGNASYDQGKYEEAYRYLTRAILLNNTDVKLYYRIGKCAQALGKSDRMETYYRKVAELQPDDPIYAECYQGAANSYFKGKKNDKALECLNKAIQLNPNLADAYFTRGSYLASINQTDAAITDLSKAIQLKPDMGMAYYNRGYINGNLSKYDLALPDMNKSIELLPKMANAYYVRGIINAKLNKTIEAKADFAQAYKLDARLAIPAGFE